MVYMKNYQIEHISSAIKKDSHEFILVNRSFNGQRGVLHIQVGVGKKIIGLEIMNKVGFCALVVLKGE